MTDTVPLDLIARLHDQTTLLHAFVYFSPEAAAHYAAAGIEGRSGYFASRTAAMGPLPTEMVIATFYNFSPDLVQASMQGVWDTVTAAAMQDARWAAVREVLDRVVAPVMSDDAIDEALDIAERVVAGLSWSGRPLAAGNAAVLDRIEGTSSSDRLLRLWQLTTIIREWRGDGHIALLVAEALDGAQCTVVSEALTGRSGRVRTSRAWSDTAWDAAVAALVDRGWADADGNLTDDGRERRADIERRTNVDSIPMWATVGESDAARFADLVAPATKALLAADYFAAMGRPAKS